MPTRNPEPDPPGSAAGIRKRSVTIDGHRTSISLEGAFWDALAQLARERGLSVQAVVAEIDHARQRSNLSSAIRVHLLNRFRGTAEGGDVARSP